MSKYVGFKLGKVHDRHVISEYYCGGCGYPVTDHDSFCPECGGAFRKCDASYLEYENTHTRIVKALSDMVCIIELAYEPDRTRTNAIDKLYQCLILLNLATIKDGEAPEHVTNDD